MKQKITKIIQLGYYYSVIERGSEKESIRSMDLTEELNRQLENNFDN